MTNRTLTASLLTLGTALAAGGARLALAQQSDPSARKGLPAATVAEVKPQAVPAPHDTDASAATPTGLGALSGRPDAPATVGGDGSETADLLGPVYENRAAGILMRPPAGSKTIRKNGGDEVVEFVNEQRRWALKVMVITTQQPIGLTTTKDVNGREMLGLMEITKDRVARALPEGATAEGRFLREDVINIADGIPSEDPRQRVPNVGMLALRYTKGLERLLGQQAIIQANEQMYYLITLISPGKPLVVKKDGASDTAPAKAPKAATPAKAAAADELPAETLENADPNERLAVEAFRQVIDSVKLLDRSKIRQDQEDRLVRTRALLVNFTPNRMKQAMVPEQCYRLIKKGKDIGFVYTVEKQADGIPMPKKNEKGEPVVEIPTGEKGILVGTRSRILLEDSPTQIDAESWMFVTFDRRHEDWTNQIVTTDRTTGKKDYVTEVGTSDKQNSVSLDKVAIERGIRGENLGPGREDKNQPPVRRQEDYFVNVTHSAKGGNAEPVNRPLPPWYMPQALSKMLPRLVDYKRASKSPEPVTYMFAQYVGDSRAVMNRYVDVEPLQKVTLAGRSLRAIPVRDRITIDGPVTTHYLSENGMYLGSEAADSGVAVIPATEAKLHELWKDADLSRPSETQALPTATATPPQHPTAAVAAPGSTRSTPAATDPNQPRRITPVRRPPQ
jgi:hypothetical protein